MENKIMKFNYEDTDKKIEVEIYGLIFEIDKEVMNNKNTDIFNKSDDEHAIENAIEEIIGEGAVKKLNEKRKQDGYNEMTIDVEVAVLACIYKAYMTASADTMVDTINNYTSKYEQQFYNSKKYNNYNHYNRYERRNVKYGRR